MRCWGEYPEGSAAYKTAFAQAAVGYQYLNDVLYAEDAHWLNLEHAKGQFRLTEYDQFKDFTKQWAATNPGKSFTVDVLPGAGSIKSILQDDPWYLVALGIVPGGKGVFKVVTKGDEIPGAVADTASAATRSASSYKHWYDVVGYSAEKANSSIISKYGATAELAWKPGTRVVEYTTTVEEKYVRVVIPGGDQASVWMARLEDVQGLSPVELKQKFALSAVPDTIVDVTIPAGTRVRTGIAAENKWGTGGGRQFEIMVDETMLPTAWFDNPRKL